MHGRVDELLGKGQICDGVLWAVEVEMWKVGGWDGGKVRMVVRHMVRCVSLHLLRGQAEDLPQWA